MMFSKYANQVFFADVCVALGCRDRTMAQELLHNTDVRPVAQKQGRYRVSQHVRGHMSLNPRMFPHLSEDFRNTLSR